MGYRLVSKENPKIVNVVGAVIIIVVLGIIFSPDWGHLNREKALNNYKGLYFEGIVDSIYFDTGNHSVKTAILKNQYQFKMFKSWESEIMVGDSLFKKKGALEIEVYKKTKGKIVLSYKKEMDNWK